METPAPVDIFQQTLSTHPLAEVGPKTFLMKILLTHTPTNYQEPRTDPLTKGHEEVETNTETNKVISLPGPF